VSLSAVNACLRTRRQHPRIISDRARKSYQVQGPKSPAFGDGINVTGRGHQAYSGSAHSRAATMCPSLGSDCCSAAGSLS
jgi:hypothetical protein